MSTRKWHISRRTALKGLGATVALPLLDVMAPQSALAKTAAAQATAPTRMAFVFAPNGMIMEAFTPKKLGADFDLPSTLKPLAPVKDDILVLSGLAHDNARAKGDGAGDHARSSAAFLTGAHPRKTDGKDIKLGISADQFAAQRVGSKTMLPSLELSCDRGRQAGRCDSGYSCAYVSNIAWRSATTPVPSEIDPAAVFERLFGSRGEREDSRQRARRIARRQSILDYVADDAKRLEGQLGVRDQQKLDEFSQSMREIERRIERTRDEKKALVPPKDVAEPAGIPRQYADHLRLMYDMMALAFRMDLTRVSTFMVALAGSNRSYGWLGVPDGHHAITHHRNNAEKIAKIKKINQFHVEQYAYFIQQLKAIPEGDGTLLDNCMVVLGSGIADGNRHSHHDLPTLLAGRGGGTIEPGRHLRYKQDTPLCNLFLEMLDRMDASTDEFGDSTGRLGNLGSA